MKYLALLIVILLMGCKDVADFEEHCKSIGGEVTYERTNDPKVIYVRCVDEDGKVIK